MADLLPGANFLINISNDGGMVAELRKASPRLLNWALHAASGILIAIVAIEIMPEAFGTLAGWWFAAAFAAGGVTYTLLESLTERLQQRAGDGDECRTGMWMIYVAVAIDLTSDGLMLGAGSAISLNLALVLAVGQVLADVPEGYAAVANFRDKEVPRLRRVLLSASFFIYVIGAALVAYFLAMNA